MGALIRLNNLLDEVGRISTSATLELSGGDSLPPVQALQGFGARDRSQRQGEARAAARRDRMHHEPCGPGRKGRQVVLTTLGTREAGS